MSPPDQHAPGSLIGRSEELARLRGALEADAVVVVVGEGGIGKTALVQEAVHDLDRKVVVAQGLRFLSDDPTLLTRQLLGPTSPVGDLDSQAAAVEAMVNGGVLVVEDAHWLHPLALEFLAAVARRVTTVATIRRGDPGAPAALDALAADGPASTAIVELGPLGEEDADVLAAVRAPEASVAGRRSIVASTGGNPLLIEEACRHGLEAGTLRDLMAVRVADLAPDLTDAAVVLAAAGRPVPLDVVGPISHRLVAEGLADVPVDDSIRVRHALLAEAIVEVVGPERVAEAHRLLSETTTDPEHRARHLARAGRRLEARVAAETAAGAAATPAGKAAMAWFAAGLFDPAIDPLDQPSLDALVDAASRADSVLGMPSEAAAFLESLSVPTDLDVVALRLALAAALTGAGRQPEAHEIYAELGRTDLDPTHPAAARVLTARARGVLAEAWDFGAAIPILEDAVAAAERAGSPDPVPLTLLASCRSMVGADGWEDTYRAAIAAADTAGTPEQTAISRSQFMHALAMRGRAEEAEHWLEEAIAATHRHELLRLRRELLIERARLRTEAGDHAEALSVVDEAVDGSGDGRLLALALGVVGPAMLALGLVDEGRARFGAAVDVVPQDMTCLTEVAWGLARFELAAGHPEEAGRALSRLRGLDIPFPNIAGTSHLLAAWARLDGASGVEDEDLPELDPDDPLFGEGQALRAECLGVRALADGAPDVAAGLLSEAMTRWEEEGSFLVLGARWARAEAMAARGDEGAAVAELIEVETEAARRYRALLPRVIRSLRRLGVDRREPVPDRRGPAGLSPREVQVLELVGQGLSNRVIGDRLGSSARTVESQVRSAMAKLGATTRAQAATMLAATPGGDRGSP